MNFSSKGKACRYTYTHVGRERDSKLNIDSLEPKTDCEEVRMNLEFMKFISLTVPINACNTRSKKMAIALSSKIRNTDC